MSGNHSACHFLLLICEHFSIFVIYPWSLKGNSDCHRFYILSQYGKAVKLICRRASISFCFLVWEQSGKHSMERHSVIQEKLTRHCAGHRNLLITIFKMSFLKAKDYILNI